MEELYIEGLAIRGGPESCVGVPRGRSEALTGVRAGRLLSLVINWSGVPTLFLGAEGNIGGGVMRVAVEPRGVGEPVHARDLSRRENREVRWPPACGDGRAGRAGKAKAVIP